MEQENTHTCFLYKENEKTGQNEMVLRRCALSPININSPQIEKNRCFFNLLKIMGLTVRYNNNICTVESIEKDRVYLKDTSCHIFTVELGKFSISIKLDH